MIQVTSKLKFNPNMAEDTSATIVKFLDRVGSRAQRIARGGAPKDTGQLVNSINIVRDYNPPAYVGGIRTNLPHAIVMEEGRKAGARMPPFDPIYRWVVRHRSSFGVSKKRSGVVKMSKAARARLSENQESQLRNIANAVRWKIKQRGIDPHKFFEKAETVVRAEFAQEIRLLGLNIKKAWEKY